MFTWEHLCWWSLSLQWYALLWMWYIVCASIASVQTTSDRCTNSHCCSLMWRQKCPSWYILVGASFKTLWLYPNCLKVLTCSHDCRFYKESHHTWWTLLEHRSIWLWWQTCAISHTVHKACILRLAVPKGWQLQEQLILFITSLVFDAVCGITSIIGATSFEVNSSARCMFCGTSRCHRML